MDKIKFKAFDDATSSVTLDNLTLENQGDRVSIYGSMEIRVDQHGLAYAKQLAQLLEHAIEYLEQHDLPEKPSPPEEGDEVENPFWQS